MTLDDVIREYGRSQLTVVEQQKVIQNLNATVTQLRAQLKDVPAAAPSTSVSKVKSKKE